MERFEFEGFVVDAAQRRLTRGGAPLELSSRYFDALVLMLERPGQLVRRDEFLDTAWQGVPVTDEALSQCIAQLRRLLGDDAARPRFIETVPKHGYRFIAPVEARGAQASAPLAAFAWQDWQSSVAVALAGMAGGAMAGVAGGLIYGLGASPDPLRPAVGAASFLLVMLGVNILAAAIGGLGVGAGIAVAHRLFRPMVLSTTLGAAVGGLLVGAAVKLFGTDVFSVLFGKAPFAIGGGMEGLILGGAVGLGMHFSLIQSRSWPSVSGSALAGAVAGAILPLLGGRLMAASLDNIAATYPGSPINVDALGRWFGEEHFGIYAQIGLTTLEGLLFGAMVALAIRFARRTMREPAER